MTLRAGAAGPDAIAGAPWLVAALGAWLGATALFGAVVAPALFTVLPSREVAGLVVGRILPVLFVGGMVVGALSLGLALVRRPTPPVGLACAAGGACMVLACAAAQLAVGPRIRRVRAAIGPSLDALGPGDPLRAEFGRLHGVSVGLLGIAALAALAALVACGVSASRRPARDS